MSKINGAAFQDFNVSGGLDVKFGGGNDLFVHISAIVDAGPRGLAEGQKVEFEEGPGRKGPQATNVRPI